MTPSSLKIIMLASTCCRKRNRHACFEHQAPRSSRNVVPRQNTSLEPTELCGLCRLDSRVSQPTACQQTGTRVAILDETVEAGFLDKATKHLLRPPLRLLRSFGC
eukprot:1027911-Amphidinium_carterae.1